jgi:hypothetical protein
MPMLKPLSEGEYDVVLEERANATDNEGGSAPEY